MVIYTLLDEAIGVILKSCDANGYTMLVTADHGNAETMIDDHGNPVTKHTTYRGELLQLQCGGELLVMLITQISFNITTGMASLYHVVIWNDLMVPGSATDMLWLIQQPYYSVLCYQ